MCFLCNKPIASFKKENPCLHWLLRPRGFKKKHFPDLFRVHEYTQISAYARWAATVGAPLKNINDLKDEHKGGKFIDFTARYKHIKWSFSCGESDFIGHPGKAGSDFPHYHFQMQLDDRPFINYKDFHIPFHEGDMLALTMQRDYPNLVHHDYGSAMSMGEVFDNEELMHTLVDHSTPMNDEESAGLHMSTILMAKEGERLSGDDLADAFEQAHREKRTVASVFKEKFKDSHIITEISAGDGVVQAHPRSERKKR